MTDPELDESIVDLGFISRVEVHGNRVEVAFRLPMFWCSANFAWIMAEDIRAALAELPWLDRADIRLVDHFAAKRINAGIAAGDGFAKAFAGESSGDLSALRETFRQKAFLGRMSHLIEALRASGLGDADILALRVADLRDIVCAAGDPPLAVAAKRYLDFRSVYGGPASSGEPAFRSADGEAIPQASLAAYLRDIRMTRRGVEANGEMCRILLKARYREAPDGAGSQTVIPAKAGTQ